MPLAPNEIENQTIIVLIHDPILSCAFLAIGIELRKDPPYGHKIEGGKEIWTFAHQPKSICGRWDAQELRKDFYAADIEEKKEKWRAQGHPFVAALDMAENIFGYAAHMAEDIPWVAFLSQDGEKTVRVKFGSAKHRKAKEDGLKQL